MLGLSLGAAAAILADSLYYGSLDAGALLDCFHGSGWAGGCALSAANVTMTSYNNLRYNTDPARLAQHGIHWCVSPAWPIRHGDAMLTSWHEAPKS
jgi:hypothetical protein